MKHYTNQKCECLSCSQGVEAMQKFEAKCIEKEGWYSHLVFDDPCSPANTNAHTHNIQEAFGHKDFQICLNVRPDLINQIFHDIVREVKSGVKIEPGKKYDRIIRNYKVEFIDAIECGRPVLRLLIPDVNGKYEGPYAAQLTKLNNKVTGANVN